MYDRDRLLAHLAELSIDYRAISHPAVATVEEAKRWYDALPGLHSKNLFLKDAKDQLWLVTLPSEQPLDLKSLPQKIGSKRLSFGRAELLWEVLGVRPGSVTPFAIVNDTGRRVNQILDASFLKAERVCHHPMINTESISVTPDEMMRFFTAIGREPRIVDLAT